MTPIPTVAPTALPGPAQAAAAPAGEVPVLLPGEAFAELLASGLLADVQDPQLPVEEAAAPAAPTVDAALALALAGLPLTAPPPGLPATAPRGQPVRELATPEAPRRMPAASLAAAKEPQPVAERLVARSAIGAVATLPAAVNAPAFEAAAVESPLAPDAVLQEAPARPAADVHSLAAAKLAPPPGMEIRAPVRAAGWDAEIGQAVQWMVGERLQVATLNLNPPELGPLEIVVHLAGDAGSQASVSFASPHAEVRAAIEDAMPRLRDMLGNAGIQLGQATVSAESFRERGDEAQRGREGGGAAAAAAQLPVAVLRTGQGLIDTFV